MPKFCVYCGSPVKETDKFCISCGKPMLTDLPKPERRTIIEEPKKIKEEKKIKEKEEEVKAKEKEGKKEETKEEEIEEDESEEESEEDTDKKKKEKEKKKSKKEKAEKEAKPLPEEVKKQLTLYIELSDITLNKKILAEKLKEISVDTKNPNYDLDIEFRDKVNLKLEAIKKLIEELKQKENEIKKQMTEPFIVQDLNNKIKNKTFQLNNLTREFRMHKIDKETFEKLRKKYKQDKNQSESEREDLISGIKIWIQELKEEKTTLIGERKLNKGRLSAKEIAEEEFKIKDSEFEKKLKKLDSKMGTLQDLSK